MHTKQTTCSKNMGGKMLAIVGNPNVGKTVLFNNICKENERVGNWHGVTTKEKYGQVDGEVVVDLPGVYNLGGYSLEEKVTADFIFNNDCNIINICSKEGLARNLYLTMLLLEQGCKVAIVVNTFEKSGAKVDYNKLKRLLGVQILAINAKTIKGEYLLGQEFACAVPKYCDDKFKALGKEEQIKIRYEYIDKVLKESTYTVPNKKFDYDNLFLGKFSLVIFALMFCLFFYICFGSFGNLLSSNLLFVLDKFIKAPIYNFLYSNNCGDIVLSIVCDGVLSSVIGLAGFLPQIMLVGFFIYFLENSGYLSRIAFLFNGLLSKIGLSGKSVFSLLVGFGCNTSAVLTTNNQESIIKKKKLCILLPFVCCSAKLPVMVVFTKLLFDNFGLFVTVLLYVFSFAVGVIVLGIVNKIYKESDNDFLLEVANYQMPQIKGGVKSSIDFAKNFIIKVSTTILIANVFIWFLQSFDFCLNYKAQESILEVICKKISFIFAPIGIDNWGFIASIFVGVMAKELILTTMSLVYQIELAEMGLLVGMVINKVSLLVFLVFAILYSPCISYISAISKTFGKKFAMLLFFMPFVVAYVVSLFVYFFAMLYQKMLGFFVLGIIALVSCGIILIFGGNNCKKCKNKNCLKCLK